jgi:hypothetical protein
MLRYEIGVLIDRWENILPPIQRGPVEETIEIDVDDGTGLGTLRNTCSNLFDDDRFSPTLTRRRVRTGLISSRPSIFDTGFTSPKTDIKNYTKLPKLPELTSEGSHSTPPMDQKSLDGIRPLATRGLVSESPYREGSTSPFGSFAAP